MNEMSLLKENGWKFIMNEQDFLKENGLQKIKNGYAIKEEMGATGWTLTCVYKYSFINKYGWFASETPLDSFRGENRKEKAIEFINRR